MIKGPIARQSHCRILSGSQLRTSISGLHFIDYRSVIQDLLRSDDPKSKFQEPGLRGGADNDNLPAPNLNPAHTQARTHKVLEHHLQQWKIDLVSPKRQQSFSEGSRLSHKPKPSDPQAQAQSSHGDKRAASNKASHKQNLEWTKLRRWVTGSQATAICHSL